MPVMRKKILELYDFGKGLGIRQLAEATGHSRNTIRKVILQAEEAGITKEQLAKVNEAELKGVLSPPARGDYEPLDYEYLAKENDKAGVNLKLLWVEYCEDCARKEAVPYQYSRFCDLFGQWSEKHNVTRRIEHRPAYVSQADWVGDVGRVVADRITGEQAKAYFFVMTMPYSGRMFVEAFPNMKQESWIAAHVHSYRFFGGVTAITVPDNLRTGISKSDRFEPVVNEMYNQMAEHYGTVIVPTQVYSPKGKAHVERTVKTVETWVIARLRKHAFYSFGELNEAVAELVGDLNSQISGLREETRDEIFFRDEQPLLLPLPADDFEMATWKTAKLQQDGHFQFERMRYSAPCAYIGRSLDLRVTASSVAVYVEGGMVCIHQRLHGRIGQYSTVEEHMPEHLRNSANRLWSAAGFEKWAHSVGPATEAVVRAIITSRPVVEQAYRSCRGLKSLADKKGYPMVENACSKARELSAAPSYTQVRNILAAMETAPVRHTNQDKLVNGSVGELGYLRDPLDYGDDGKEA